LRGNYSDQRQERGYRNALREPDAVITRHPNSFALSGTLNVPWIDKSRPRPALQRFDTELATNFSDRSSAGATQDQRWGVSWAPLKSLLLRGSLANARLAPAQFLAEAQPLVTETFIDPRRTPNTADEVQLITRDFEGVSRGRTEQLVLGASFDPPAIPGLQLTVNYDRRERKNLTASSLEAQDVIYNESALPERVTRAAPTANDLALNQPGAILAVDATPIEGGSESSSGLAFTMEYRVPSERFGQFRISASARHPLASTYEIRPGVPFVFEDDSSANPPEWTARSQISWSRRGWQISTNLRYTDEVIAPSFVTPATTELDVRFGYRFRAAVWKGWGRGLHVAVGVGNLTQGEPPFANTLTGFRGGSALGRTYSLTLRVPLGTSRREQS
jgi:iron complex outermembrane recepter protein